jgi:Na+-transporting methylmalonyl-CoA/oxaloacetate decarboxylase gamma subunit
VSLHGVLPRVYGVAFAMRLVSGIYLARLGMAIIFLVLWTTLYLALVIFIAWDVLTQVLKPPKAPPKDE